MSRHAPDFVLRASGLTKRFGDILAVDALDLEVRRGEILDFLGPNGAGETTTLRLMFFSEAMLPLPKIRMLQLGGRALYANDVLPTTLCVRAFNRILNFGAGLGDVGFELGAVLILTAFYGALGTWLFYRRHLRI